MLYCGTSGFSYDDWVGMYYPPGLPRRNWLSYYAQEFNALELNSTYYTLPDISVMQSLVRKTGEGFLFSVKANQDMTHKRQAGRDIYEAFVKILQPLIAANKLGCILAQFPYSFNQNAVNFKYLQCYYDWIGGLPLVVEFRNATWLNEDVLKWMRERNIGFCCVDEPQLPSLLPPVAEVTGDIAYIRFHGRNTAKWWQHDEAWERYDYTYKREELQEWLPKISQMNKLAKNTFIFANNHWRSQAVDTIRQVRSMLDQLVL
ncbi:MAG: DUF72 domain-containing protein [Dehalococcoidia bacterium]